MDPFNSKAGFPHLLNIHNQFDGDSSDDESIEENHELSRLTSSNHVNIISKVESYSKSSILSLALINFICSFLEKNAVKSKMLYKAVCDDLCKQKFLDDNITLLHNVVQPQFGDEIYSYIVSLKKKIETGENLSSFIYPLMSSTYQYQTSQYAENFDELEVIASGGFGIVAKAKHKVDGATYAVKKIFFKCKNDKEFEKIIREARSFASLKHPNIVNYNNAWLDCSSIADGVSKSSSSATSSEANTAKNCKSPSVGERRAEDSESDSTCDIQFSEDCSSSGIKYVEKCETEESFSVKIEETCDTSSITTDTSASSYSQLSSTSSSSSLSSVLLNKTLDTSSSTVTTRQRHSSGPTCSSVDYSIGNKIVVPSIRATNVDVEKVRQNFSLSRLPGALFPSIKATLYIQMEYCDFDLRTWLDDRRSANNGFLTFKDMAPINIFRQVLCGIEHIHSKGIIHRDLKPRNIFIMEQNGNVKIGDFGLACLVHQTNEAPCLHCYCEADTFSLGLGTPPYAAPEQISTRNYDFKVDIFSAGIILFELLHPCMTSMEFSSEVKKICGRKFPGTLRVEHVEVLEKMIEQDPKERPTAAEILQYPMFMKRKVKKQLEDFHKKALALERIQRDTMELNEALKKEIEENETLINHLAEDIETKETEIQSLQEQMEMKDIKIKSLQQEVEIKDGEIELLKQQIAMLRLSSVS